MDQILKIKEGFMLKNIADNYVVVSVGEGNVNFNSMITTNETGSFLWEILKDGATKQQLVDALLAEYDVEEEIVAADVERFVQKLEEKNILA
ncbi:MAG: PqqD family protein [Eubacteriales bacterium]|nr:PqqD family protein [Eubacteriales bacterium]